MIFLDEDGEYRGPRYPEDYEKAVEQQSESIKRLNSGGVFNAMALGIAPALIEILLATVLLTFAMALGAAQIFSANINYWGEDFWGWLLSHIIIFAIITAARYSYLIKKRDSQLRNIQSEMAENKKIISLLNRINELENQ